MRCEATIAVPRMANTKAMSATTIDGDGAARLQGIDSIY